MKKRLLIQIGIALAMGVSALHAQIPTPSSQSLCDMPSQRGTAMYAKYCGGGAAAKTAPAAPTLNPALANAAQNLGYSMGQQLGKALFNGNNATNAANAAAQQQQQRNLAAQQLNNSGLYLLRQKTYTGTIGAINEFQKALAITPNDANIIHNLALAKQQLKDVTVAQQTSGALSSLLGPAPANTGLFGDQLTSSSVANPNASALSLVNLDAGVVDLRGTTNASPESLKTELNGVFAKNAPASAPPDPRVDLPQVQDIELLFQPPQATSSSWPGPQRPANNPKLLNPIDGEEQTKAQVQAVAARPGGLNDIEEQQLIENALAGLDTIKSAPAVPAGTKKDAPAKPTSTQPHN